MDGRSQWLVKTEVPHVSHFQPTQHIHVTYIIVCIYPIARGFQILPGTPSLTGWTLIPENCQATRSRGQHCPCRGRLSACGSFRITSSKKVGRFFSYSIVPYLTFSSVPWLWGGASQSHNNMKTIPVQLGVPLTPRFHHNGCTSPCCFDHALRSSS